MAGLDRDSHFLTTKAHFLGEEQAEQTNGEEQHYRDGWLVDKCKRSPTLNTGLLSVPIRGSIWRVIGGHSGIWWAMKSSFSKLRELTGSDL